MSKAPFIRRGLGMFPAGPEAMDIVTSIKDGAECMGSFKSARNIRQLRLFFAMLQVIVDNTEFFENVDQAKQAIKLATHEADIVVDETGKVFYVLRSLSCESMPQDRFNRFFDRSIHVILTKWIPDMDEGELRQEIEDMVDGQSASSLGTRTKRG